MTGKEFVEKVRKIKGFEFPRLYRYKREVEEESLKSCKNLWISRGTQWLIRAKTEKLCFVYSISLFSNLMQGKSIPMTHDLKKQKNV